MKGVINMISKESITKQIINDAKEVVDDILANSKDSELTRKLLVKYQDLIILSCELNNVLSK